MPEPAVPLDDVLLHVDRALDGMRDTLTRLGDERANRVPDLPGANSAYQIVAHCLGVMEQWGGAVIAGRAITRDRDAELASSGDVAGLLTRLRDQRERLAADLAGLDGTSAPVGPLPAHGQAEPFTRTQGGVLMHLYEELAQHRGHLDLTADLVSAGED